MFSFESEIDRSISVFRNKLYQIICLYLRRRWSIAVELKYYLFSFQINWNINRRVNEVSSSIIFIYDIRLINTLKIGVQERDLENIRNNVR